MCGLNSSAIQKRLLAESDLILKRALEIAQSMEAAAKQAGYLNLSKPTASGDQGAVQVMTGGMAQSFGNKPNSIEGKQQFQRSPPCFRCGRQDHDTNSCKFKNQTCHICNNRGHISVVCRKDG